MRIIPPPHSPKWLTFGLMSTAVISVLIMLSRFLMNGQDFDLIIAMRLILLSFILSVVYSLMGWFGATRMWVCSNAGLLLGLVLMVYFSNGTTGWEELIGILVFMQMVVAGIALGIVVEVVRFIYLKIKNSRS